MLVVATHFEGGDDGVRFVLVHFLHVRGVFELQADDEADQHQQGGHEERDAPTPAEELLFGHHLHQEERAGTQQRTGGHTGLRP